MASKRKKGNRWEFVVKRAGVLDRPLYLTFESEAEGDEHCRRLEAMLDRGIVPSEYQPAVTTLTLGALIEQYLRDAHPSQKDRETLRTVVKAKGRASMVSIDANWVDAWITAMKRERRLTPATIRAKVGAAARACDWGMRKKLVVLPDHPFRTLHNGYATYTAADAALAGVKMSDVERDRRLEPGEEDAIRRVIAAGVLPRKQRPRHIDDPTALLVLFDLALESAMRLREMYTLTPDQIDLPGRTVYLSKTKNGDSRQVPLSSVAVRVLRDHIDRRGAAALIFPWWDGDATTLGLRRATNYLSKLFADVFETAGCADLHEHDLRHEAISRFFERTNMSAEEIMKCTGHRTHKMVMRYLKLRGSNLAAKLW